MSARFRAAAALAVAAATLVLPRAGALACSVCLAGDPSFSSTGASVQEQGDFYLYLEARGWRKTSGSLAHGAEDEAGHEEAGHDEHAAHDHEAGHEDAKERNRGQRIDAYLSWTPIDRLSLSLDIPFAFNRIVETEGDEETNSTLAGLGDVSLATSIVLWRNRDVLPTTWLEGRAFVKAPTGDDEEKVDGVRDPHLQVGTGSWDFGGGLAVTHRLSFGSLFGSVLYRENTEGALDYEYGDVWLANAAIEVPLGHATGRPGLAPFVAGFELNFRYSEYDVADGERYRDSGGAILYATPSLRWRLPFGDPERPPSLRFAVQLPLAQTWLHNQQREKEGWSVGLLVPF
jgi:hypothetical protein